MNDLKPKKRVLIVDDEPDIRWLLTTYLRSEGHIAYEASNIREAINLFKALHTLDLILLDMALVDGSGLKFLDFLRDEGLTANVVVVSAYDHFKDTALSRGAADFFSKPIDVSKLDEMILKS